MVDLLAQTTSSIGSGSRSSNIGRGCLCAAATAAAGQQCVQWCTSRLAALLAAATAQCRVAMGSLPLAAAASVLRCMCEGNDSCGSSGPTTVENLHSPQGAQLLHTRVATPTTVLKTIADWFSDSNNGLLSHLTGQQVRDVHIFPTHRGADSTLQP